MTTGIRPVVAAVAALNLAYFGVEFAVALLSDSVALFADSIDFLETRASTCSSWWRSAGALENGP